VDSIFYYILNEVSGRLSVKEYLRKYSQGFPVSEMNKICKSLFELRGINVLLWKKSGKGEWKNIINFGKTPHKSVEYNIPLFLMDDRGKILNIKENAIEAMDKFRNEGITDGSLGHMVHCITVYPAPWFFEGSIAANIGKMRSLLCKQISLLGKGILDSLYQKNKYNPDIEYHDIREYVEFQNARYRRREVSTLIFDPTPHSSVEKGGEDSLSSSDSSLSKKRKRYNEISQEREGKPRIFVYAYDLETVDNNASNQYKVYPPFRKVIPPEYCDLIDPMECQIPFSAQWVGVNLDDEEKFLNRKLNESLTPLDYSSTSTYTSGEDKDYFITDVHTDYGDSFLLGECIESFLVDIAVDTHAKGGTTAVLYATNGSKFDSYVTLQYQRFEIVDMLKTSRGIMFAKLRVPLVKPPIETPYDYRDHKYASGEIRVTIILRDISLLMSGSLNALCKGFDVPKKYCKQDFPIQMVNATNCYDPRVMVISREYGEMDVCALAIILKKVNRLIGNSHWDPASHRSDKPPIIQFLTIMSMIRNSLKLHFDKVLPSFLHPRAVDIPVLRNWISMAAIGGRVSAYMRTYMSDYFSDIMRNFSDKEVLKVIHRGVVGEGKCMQCLDVTSLYPFVMDSCPMPMGSLCELPPHLCQPYIDAFHCPDCDTAKTLCPKHRYYFGTNDSNLRPFAIIIVKNVTPIPNASKPLQNLCPRKTYNVSTGKPVGLNYSLETNEEFFERKNGKEKMLETQAYTNVDLYWMGRQGFTYDIVGGITWSTTMAFNSFIGPAFQWRIEAKKAGNKLLSNFMKLNYNGAYGVTIQQDITDSFFLTNLPEEYRFVNTLEPTMRENILRSLPSDHHNDLLASEELTGEAFNFPSGQSFIQKRKKEHLAEFYAKQSPMQVGAAILAYARHIGNLVLFNLQSERDYGYTDTDSINISEDVIMNDAALQRLICNRDDAPMGSFKNDHAEGNGTEPRIVFGLIGAKKVKCYITLNGEGELRIFNTFKGLNVSLDLEGKKINPQYAEYMSTKAILNINETYTSEPVIVQSWKRDLSTGVSIGNHLQHFEGETYNDFFQGTLEDHRQCGFIEYIIPHGKLAIQSLNDGGYWPSNEPPPPRFYEDDRELLQEFIEKYYEGSRNEYNPGTEEYKKILEVFNSLI
jgi:hypothetical protein